MLELPVVRLTNMLAGFASRLAGIVAVTDVGEELTTVSGVKT